MIILCILLKILAIVVPLQLGVAYLTLAERKVTAPICRKDFECLLTFAVKHYRLFKILALVLYSLYMLSIFCSYAQAEVVSSKMLDTLLCNKKLIPYFYINNVCIDSYEGAKLLKIHGLELKTYSLGTPDDVVKAVQSLVGSRALSFYPALYESGGLRSISRLMHAQPYSVSSLATFLVSEFEGPYMRVYSVCRQTVCAWQVPTDKMSISLENVENLSQDSFTKCGLSLATHIWESQERRTFDFCGLEGLEKGAMEREVLLQLERDVN